MCQREKKSQFTLTHFTDKGAVSYAAVMSCDGGWGGDLAPLFLLTIHCACALGTLDTSWSVENVESEEQEVGKSAIDRRWFLRLPSLPITPALSLQCHANEVEKRTVPYWRSTPVLSEWRNCARGRW
ncbi:hypothetical protein CEXT_615731 [Caerostris extrusa]|uniref:Uncharacterized protein n=1 Tax=Caerostris extrusa TaxID=172846 RepID=A0AAV4SN30_CAEEX|nr:hypothetical protein CEXT_615731 [Caerostris extrusa]